MGDYHPDSKLQVTGVTLTPARPATTDEEGTEPAAAGPLQVAVTYVITLPSGADVNRTLTAAIEHEQLQDHGPALAAFLQSVADLTAEHAGLK